MPCRPLRLAAAALAAAAWASPAAPGASSWRSALYPVDWTPETAAPDGSRLPDFSFAGYRNGGPPPVAPPGPVIDAVAEHGADATGATDATGAIQSAIDAASSAGGGVVFLPAGTYRVDGTLSIRASGVVLRGAGPSETLLVGTRTASMSDRATVEFAGSVVRGPHAPLAADGAEGSRELRVADASAFVPGDEVAVGWTITPEFVDEHGMTGTWVAFAGEWKPFFRRVVAAVDVTTSPHTVALDIPIRYPAKTRDGASIRRETGHLREVGCESLSVTNAVARADAWAADRAHAISVSGAADAWVRNVASAPRPADPGGDHLQSGGVLVVDSRRVTVAACSMRRAQNRGPGGNGYLFEVSRSGEVLFADCVAEDGRHNFIQNWDHGTTGCVFLRCASRGGRAYVADWDPFGYPSYSEYHHSLATANLVDSCVLEDGWSAGNRGNESSGAGHSATACVFWNLSGGGLLRSHQFARGWVIGPGDMTVQTTSVLPIASGTEPEDTVERGPPGAALEPESLYDDQLRRRLGATSITRVRGGIVADLRPRRGSLRIDLSLAPPPAFDPAADGFEMTVEGEAFGTGLVVGPGDPGWRTVRRRFTRNGADAQGGRWRVVVGADRATVHVVAKRLTFAAAPDAAAVASITMGAASASVGVACDPVPSPRRRREFRVSGL
ncbi:MAG: hypothetical protein HMLKMBBP_03463 [Planctomycetes bacterium]|nr:hypothetical protein [Planctomycetota bacterium]